MAARGRQQHGWRPCTRLPSSSMNHETSNCKGAQHIRLQSPSCLPLLEHSGLCCVCAWKCNSSIWKRSVHLPSAICTQLINALKSCCSVLLVLIRVGRICTTVLISFSITCTMFIKDFWPCSHRNKLGGGHSGP